MLLLIAWLKLPKKWAAICLATGVAMFVIINVYGDRQIWKTNIYLYRLITLIDLQKTDATMLGRFGLYKKAASMIIEHPITGHGLGSFYLKSVRYAWPNDPEANVPNFTHNFVLLIATEMGLLVAGLFLGLIAMILLQGVRFVARATRSNVSAGKERTGRQSVRHDENKSVKGIESVDMSAKTFSHALRWLQEDKSAALEVLGVMIALTAYLLTQMTANSLNVYISNQFFFWFLMAAVLSGSEGMIKTAQLPDISTNRP
jgi:O-antigen ligase